LHRQLQFCPDLAQQLLLLQQLLLADVAPCLIAAGGAAHCKVRNSTILLTGSTAAACVAAVAECSDQAVVIHIIHFIKVSRR
jgi:hypothetical protein